MSIPNTLQSIHYATCPKCSKLTKAQGNKEFYCNTCETDHIAVPRCKISVEIEDISAIITATLFDKTAEKLLKNTASKLYEMTSQQIQSLLAKTNEELKSTPLIVEIRASAKKYTDNKTRYTVHDWTKDVDSGSSTAALQTGTERGTTTPDKKEGKKGLTALEETPESEETKRQGKAHATTDSAPLKKVKLEFTEKDELPSTQE